MRILLAVATVLSCVCPTAAQNVANHQESRPAPSIATSKPANLKNGSLKSVKTERAMKRMLADVRQQRDAFQKKEKERERKACLEWSKSLPEPMKCDGFLVETVTVSGMAANTDSDTNRQHDGVDEGGLVKKAGDVLVVLRRGRLFTIDTSGAQLAAMDMADLAANAAPDTPQKHDWYDELLIAGQTVIVIGYSNSHQGTEIVLFNLRERGRLEYRSTYNLRSNDYYSGDNYASRLVNGKLVLYTTRPLPEEPDNLDWLPAMRRWKFVDDVDTFERIVAWDRVYTRGRIGPFPTVHTMVICDPAAVTFTCEGSVMLGEYLSAYYASPTAGYAWTRDWLGYPEGKPRFFVYRFPFDGSPISALQVQGEPVSQLSFLESDDGHLNVVVFREDEDQNYSTLLLRVGLDAFGDGSRSAPAANYRELAKGLDWHSVRFVGDSVLVGQWSDHNEPERLVIARWRSRGMSTLLIDHSVQRIEAMGDDAIVIGPKGRNLGMTAISLGDKPATVSSVSIDGSQQAESRSHGFLYRAESAREGTFGLPLLISTASIESAAVVFIRNRGLSLHRAGSLDATDLEEPDDNCVVSCVDWYGNARAVFSGGRVFALMGYELVEGRIDGNGRIAESGRLNFSPAIQKSKH